MLNFLLGNRIIKRTFTIAWFLCTRLFPVKELFKRATVLKSNDQLLSAQQYNANSIKSSHHVLAYSMLDIRFHNKS